MNNKKYESPEIRVISVEPDESLMDTGTSQGLIPVDQINQQP